MRPTLGPLPRIVAVEPVGPRDKRPELLDIGGLIASRFLQIRDRDADTGAMFLRHVLWRQCERAGDGTATTAVLFQSIYNQGIKYIAAGGNATRLRKHLECGLHVILEQIDSLARSLDGREQIAQLAEVLCHDHDLALLIAEILDRVSEHGAVEVRSGRGRGLERQYVLGSYFNGKPLSEWMLAEQPNRRIELQDAAVLVSDLNLNDPAELVPLLHVIDAANVQDLMIVAREASEQTIGALLAAGRGVRACRIIAVKAPDAVTGQAAMLDDLAVLTGARVLLRAAGDSLLKIKPQDLGYARRAWSDEEFFGVISGKGEPRTIRTHVANLRAAYAHAEQPDTRRKIRDRIGKLLGGTAVLWVGGISDIDINARKELAKQTLEATRITIGKGILPGGGVALLGCRAPLWQNAEQAADLDERMAYQILSRALEEPTRAILHNAGFEAGSCMGAIERAAPGCGFDVRSGQVVDMAAAGIIDSAGVVGAAVHAAIAGAALALTVDVLVHTRLPELSFEP